MKIQLNTTKKTIKFESECTFREMREYMALLAPRYSDAFEDFTVSFGSVPSTGLTTINKPIQQDYEYKPNHPWLNYVVGKPSIVDDRISTGYSISFKDGTYNVEIK